MSTGLRIKDVADASGFTAATLRYYEQIGLLPEASRTPSGYRTYDERTLQRPAAALERHRPEGACDENCSCVSEPPTVRMRPRRFRLSVSRRSLPRAVRQRLLERCRPGR